MTWLISEKSKSNNLTLSIEKFFVIFYFYFAEHKFVKNFVKNEFFQIVQTITITEFKSEKSQSVRKTKAATTNQSEYLPKWTINKKQFRKIFNEFWIKTKDYKNINQFQKFIRKDENTMKNPFSEFFFCFHVICHSLVLFNHSFRMWSINRSRNQKSRTRKKPWKKKTLKKKIDLTNPIMKHNLLKIVRKQFNNQKTYRLKKLRNFHPLQKTKKNTEFVKQIDCTS